MNWKGPLVGLVLAAAVAGTYAFAGISSSPGAGGFTGPASSTDNAIVRFNGTDGAIVQDTSTLTVDDNGAMVNTAQPCFLAHPAANQSNINANTNTDVVMGTEVFDQGGDFASNIFTAPVTGRYILTYAVGLTTLDTGASFYQLRFEASNRSYPQIMDFTNMAADVDNWTFTQTIVMDMDASDTAVVDFFQSGGTAQTDIIAAETYFSGCLLA